MPGGKLVEVISGQGAAPRLATREYFASRGGIPGSGIEPAAVPAALDACLTVLDRYGTRTFADVAAPTLAILDRHQADWHADLAVTLRRLIEAEQGSGGDRSRGLRLVADYFYRGPLARELAAWCEANGGLIRYNDLATHVTRVEEPAQRRLPRLHHPQVRSVDAGPLRTASIASAGGFRSQDPRTQPAANHSSHGRGHEARPGRP